MRKLSLPLSLGPGSRSVLDVRPFGCLTCEHTPLPPRCCHLHRPRVTERCLGPRRRPSRTACRARCVSPLSRSEPLQRPVLGAGAETAPCRARPGSGVPFPGCSGCRGFRTRAQAPRGRPRHHPPWTRPAGSGARSLARFVTGRPGPRRLPGRPRQFHGDAFPLSTSL